MKRRYEKINYMTLYNDMTPKNKIENPNKISSKIYINLTIKVINTHYEFKN